MFSIIVPSYNRNRQVEELLASLEQQTLKNFEVVIIDDCSPNPIQISAKFSFPVHVLRNEVNLGPAGSRNVGAKAATFSWLLFLDDDDRFLPQKCELLEESIRQNPHVNFIYHPAKCELVNEGFCYDTKPYQDTQLATLDNLLKGNKIGGMPMLAMTKLFYFQVGGLSTELHALEDYDFVLKVVIHKEFSPYYLDKALTHCRFETKVASVSKNIKNTQQALAYIEKQYVKTETQCINFIQNSYNILAYPYVMSLSRKAAKYYFQQFLYGKKLKSLVLALSVFISPNLAIQLKRFV